jgi:transposase
MNTLASTRSLLTLPEPPPDGRIYVNGSVWFVDSDGYRVIFRWHEPLYRVALTDEVHLRLVAVALRQSQLATQEEICRAFGHDVSTQARWERQYRNHGIDGLLSRKRTGRRCELEKSQTAFVRRWFRARVSNRQMAKRLGVGEATIRRTLKRLGLTRPRGPLQPLLPHVEDAAGAVAIAEAETLPDGAGVEETAAAPAETCLPTGTTLAVRLDDSS